MKTVIEMAREAGFAEGDAMFRVAFVANENNLKRFAELARADEREACAKLCEEMCEEADSFTQDILFSTSAAIRARNKT